MEVRASRAAATVGFGVRVGGWPHCWILDVPKYAWGDVVLTEEHGVDFIVERARVGRATWRLLGDAFQDEMNARQKEVGLKRDAWRTGENRIKRILGMEVCLLLVAAAGKPPDAVRGVITGWLGLRPPTRGSPLWSGC